MNVLCGRIGLSDVNMALLEPEEQKDLEDKNNFLAWCNAFIDLRRDQMRKWNYWVNNQRGTFTVNVRFFGDWEFVEGRQCQIIPKDDGDCGYSAKYFEVWKSFEIVLSHYTMAVVDPGRTFFADLNKPARIGTGKWAFSFPRQDYYARPFGKINYIN